MWCGGSGWTNNRNVLDDRLLEERYRDGLLSRFLGWLFDRGGRRFTTAQSKSTQPAQTAECGTGTWDRRFSQSVIVDGFILRLRVQRCGFTCVNVRSILRRIRRYGGSLIAGRETCLVLFETSRRVVVSLNFRIQFLVIVNFR